MSVTPDVSHVEMWPYVVSAAAAFESHALTAHLIFQLTMTLPVSETSQSPVFVSHFTPQYVEAHRVLSLKEGKASSFAHQPRS